MVLGAGAGAGGGVGVGVVDAGALEVVVGAVVGGGAGAGTLKVTLALTDGREMSATKRWWSPGAKP